MKEASAKNVPDLFDRLCDLAPLLSALPRPARIWPCRGHCAAVEEDASWGPDAAKLSGWLQGAARSLSVPSPVLAQSGEAPTSFDLAASRHLRIKPDVERLEATTPQGIQSRRSGSKCNGGFRANYRTRARDGAQCDVVAMGDPRRPAVVLVGACAMPLQMLRAWRRILADTHFVLCVSSRGAGQDVSSFDRCGTDVASQSGDLLLAMDAVGIERAHVMGFCGGAVLALHAAARQPSRVSSVSSLHGDFQNVHPACPTTSHQEMARDLMETVSESRGMAVELSPLFSRPRALDTIPERFAHWLLVPFSTPELLYRYGCLNSSIMADPTLGVASRVSSPVLLVTSESDATTHWAGSVEVAKSVKRASVERTDAPDHLRVFDAVDSDVALVRRFLSEVEERR